MTSFGREATDAHVKQSALLRETADCVGASHRGAVASPAARPNSFSGTLIDSLIEQVEEAEAKQ